MNLLRIALRSVLGYWIRAVLAVAALCAAVVGVVTVAASSSTVEATVEARAILQGGPSATDAVTGLSGSLGLRESVLVARELRAVYGNASVVRVATLESTYLGKGGLSFRTPVAFTEPGLVGIRPFHIVSGTWLSAPTALRDHVVVNTVAAAQDDLEPGDRISLKSADVATTVPAIISGIVEDGGENPQAYATISGSSAILDGNQQQLTVGFDVTADGLSSTELVGLLNRWNSIARSSVAWEAERIDTVDRLRAEVETSRVAFLLVGAFGLFAGIVAIANIGLSTLRERSSELSLRRALGARSWHIPLLMLLESQLVAVVAAIIAVIVSYLLYPAVVAQYAAPYGVRAPPFPWPVALLGVAVGMVTALLGSLVPALNSLRLRLSDVMRG